MIDAQPPINAQDEAIYWQMPVGSPFDINHTVGDYVLRENNSPPGTCENPIPLVKGFAVRGVESLSEIYYTVDVESEDEQAAHTITLSHNANTGLYISCDTGAQQEAIVNGGESSITFTPVPGITRYYIGVSNSPDKQTIALSIDDPRLTHPLISPDSSTPTQVTTGELITITKVITNTGPGTNFSITVDSPSNDVVPVSSIITATINPGEGKPFSIPVRILTGAGAGDVQLTHTAYHEGGHLDAGTTTVSVNGITHKIFLPLLNRSQPHSDPLRQIEQAVIIIGNYVHPPHPDPLNPAMDSIAEVFYQTLQHLGLENPDDITVFSHYDVDLDDNGINDTDFEIIDDLQVLAEITQILNGMSPDGTIAVLYVGHGTGDISGNSRMLIRGNTAGNTGENAQLTGEELFYTVITPGGHRLLSVTEMCHAGALSMDALRLLTADELSRTVVIASSQANELSWVRPMGDGEYMSVTSLGLSAILSGVPASDALRYATNHWTHDLGYDLQHPVYLVNGQPGLNQDLNPNSPAGRAIDSILRPPTVREANQTALRNRLEELERKLRESNGPSSPLSRAKTHYQSRSNLVPKGPLTNQPKNPPNPQILRRQ